MNTRGIIMLGVGAVAGYVIYNQFLKPKSDNSNFTGRSKLRMFNENTYACPNGKTISLSDCNKANVEDCCV